jgi:RNA polymerase sigma factor (sigma-70 family)
MHREPQRCDREELCDQEVYLYVRSMARRLASRAGLRPPDQQDFAGQFVEQMCCHRSRDLQRYQQKYLGKGWLFRCAEHALSNYLRSQAVIHRHEIPLPYLQDEEGNEIEVEFLCAYASPEVELLRSELRQEVKQALATLESHNAALFCYRYLEGGTLAELAAREGCTEDAVRKRLARARAHLRAQLQRRGFDMETADEYLAAIADRPMSGGVIAVVLARCATQGDGGKKS